MCGIWQAECSVNCSRRVSQTGDNAAPFDRRHALPRGADLARDLDGRIERLADVDIDEGLQKYVVCPVLVDQGGAGRASFEHVVHSRQFREIERDRLRNVFGFRPRGTDAHGYQLADMTHLVGGERRLFRYLESAQA